MVLKAANEPHQQPNKPVRFGIWDILIFISTVACFLATARHIGVASVLTLPAFLIAPSVFVHRRNTTAVKIAFVVVVTAISILLIFSAMG